VVTEPEDQVYYLLYILMHRSWPVVQCLTRADADVKDKERG